MTETSAAAIPTVWACWRILVDGLAPLPVGRFRRVGDARIRIPSGDIVASPSLRVDRTAWISQWMLSMLCDGNAYGVITAVDPDTFAPLAVDWLHPSAVTPDIERHRKVLRTGTTVLQPGEFVHTSWLTMPGSIRGLSPLSALRVATQSASAAEKYLADFFRDGAHPTAILSSQRPLTPESARTAKERFRAVVGGRREALILGSGWDYKPVQISPADAGFLESAQMTKTDIANVYGVPPELVGGKVGDSMTYSSTSARMVDLQQWGIRPLAERLESAWSELLEPSEFVKINLDAPLRSTPAERVTVYAAGLTGGWLTVDEVRAKEDLPPLEATDGVADPNSIAQLLQRIYLAVGTVVSADEARELANRAGAGLTGTLEVPNGA